MKRGFPSSTYLTKGIMKFKCDFCGEMTNNIKRVVLDEDYDRLTIAHRVMYACPPCSDEKEENRKFPPRAK